MDGWPARLGIGRGCLVEFRLQEACQRMYGGCVRSGHSRRWHRAGSKLSDYFFPDFCARRNPIKVHFVQRQTSGLQPFVMARDTVMSENGLIWRRGYSNRARRLLRPSCRVSIEGDKHQSCPRENSFGLGRGSSHNTLLFLTDTLSAAAFVIRKPASIRAVFPGCP
jgi:hypothetical protein